MTVPRLGSGVTGFVSVSSRWCPVDRLTSRTVGNGTVPLSPVPLNVGHVCSAYLWGETLRTCGEAGHRLGVREHLAQGMAVGKRWTCP